MKLQCQVSEFLQAIQLTSHAVATKPQTPILSGIYMKAEEDGLVFEATDYEIGIITKIVANVEEKGEIAIEGHYLQEMAKKLYSDIVDISFTIGDKSAKISSGAFHVQLNVMNVNDYPKIIRMKEGNRIKIKDELLKSLIRKTSYACSNDQDRPIFTGCMMETEGESIRMVATNTHRLALMERTMDGIEDIDKVKKSQIIIPKRVLDELSRDLTSEVPIDIDIMSTGKEISFSFGSTYISSRLIDGQFPDYRKAIPSDFKTRVKLPVEEFKRAVDSVSFVAKSTDYNVIKMSFSLNEVHLSSNNIEVGTTEQSMPVEIDGPDIDIAFNVLYLIDVMKTMTKKEFYMSLNESLKPAIIREADDDSFTYVLTPVRTH